MTKIIRPVFLFSAFASFTFSVFSEEFAQHLVIRQGDSFRFSKDNMISSNQELAWFDGREKTGTEPGLHITDADARKGVYLHIHNPVACAPFTQYCLRFEKKVISAGKGTPVELRVGLLDFNRDGISSVIHRFEDKETGGEWLEQKLSFSTPHDARALVLAFITAPDTMADIVFDEVCLEQVSEPGALRPAAREIISVGKTVGDWTETAPVEKMDEACFISLDFDWSGAPDGPEVVFEWLSGDRRIGAEICRLSPMRGVLPQWNGMQAEWRRSFGDAADKVSLELNQFSGETGGSGHVERMLRKPEGADGLKVIAGAFPDGFRLQRLTVSASPLAVPGTGVFSGVTESPVKTPAMPETPAASTEKPRGSSMAVSLCAADNFLPNSGMEEGTVASPKGWSKAGTDKLLARWDGPAASGNKALGLVDDNPDGYGGWLSSLIELPAGAAGKPVRLSWMERYRVEGAGQIRVTVVFFDASSGIIPSATDSHMMRGKSPAWDAGGFSPASRTVKVPAEAVTMRIQFMSGGQPGVIGEAWIDNLSATSSGN
jgi:hypothetical protein